MWDRDAAIATLLLNGLMPVKQGWHFYVMQREQRNRRMYAAYSSMPGGKPNKLETTQHDMQVLPREVGWSNFETDELIFLAQQREVLEGV